MPASKHRSPKPAHLPAKTTNITPKTTQSSPIYRHVSPHPLLKQTEMSGNERDFAKIAGIPTSSPILPQVRLWRFHPCKYPPVRGTPMTISQNRRRDNILKRRFAPELAIIKLRRIAESVSDNWDPDQPLKPPTSSRASPKPASACPPS